MSLLNEAKSLVQKNYFNQKIIHMIVKKFIFDGEEFFEIPNEKISYTSLIIELKFICFSDNIWKNLQDSFNSKNLFNLIIESIKNKNKLEKISENMKNNYKNDVYINIENNIKEII